MHRHRIGWAIVMASVGVEWSLAAQQPLALRDAVALALERDTRVVNAEAVRETARRRAEAARASFGPELIAGTGAQLIYGFPQTPGGAPPSVLSVAFTQTLFDGPARGRARAAEQKVAVETLTTERVRSAVVLDTASTYLELAAVRQSLVRQRGAVASADALVGIGLDRMKEGRALPAEVLRARLERARLMERVLELKTREDLLESQLKTILHLPSGQPVQLAFETLPAPPERSVEELVAAATRESPELRSLQLEKRARDENLKGERLGYRPSVDLVGTYSLFPSWQNFDSYFNRVQRHNVNVGVQARIPIFSAATKAAVALAGSQLLETDSLIQRQREEIEGDVRRTMQRLQSASAHREVTELELALSQETVRTVDARRAEGRAGRAELASAEIEEARAWDAFFIADADRVKRQLELRSIVGELMPLFP